MLATDRALWAYVCVFALLSLLLAAVLISWDIEDRALERALASDASRGRKTEAFAPGNA
jgi:hypothetical protein